jgi:predicted membrane-bound spermidine synthase
MADERSLLPVKLLVLLGGITTLTVEMAAARLLGAYFGSGNSVWASIIGLILLYLAVGYFIGGRWADLNPEAVTLYRIVAWGAFLAGLIPFAGRVVLPVLEDQQLPLAFVVPIALILLFAVPVGLLGCLPPFALRISLQNIETVGQSAGNIYAISTLGSILGSLAPVLVLLPSLGTTATYLIASLLLLAAALGALFLENRTLFLHYIWMPVFLAAIYLYLLSLS